MTINACVKNMKTNSLPHIQSPVALIFKDEGGLVNHPLSCHPQGVFGSQENERKIEEMRENKKRGKTPAQFSVLMKLSCTITYLSLYSALSKQNYKNISSTHYTLRVF